MFSGIFFFSLRGDLLLSRLYRPNLPRGIADAFLIEIIGKKPDRQPLRVVNGVSYLYVPHNDLYVVATARKNINASLGFELLHRIIKVFTSYFGGNPFTQETLKQHYVLLFELLDEIIDHGYPQILDTDILKLYIKTDHDRARDAKKKNSTTAEQSSKITIQATGAKSWRREGIKYRKNEIWFDIIESVNLLMSSKGDPLRVDVDARVMVRSKLSGMPECQFGFNDKFTMRQVAAAEARLRRKGNSGNKKSTIQLDDVQFHQCVKLSEYGQDKSITFTPPDGEFELMRYRSTEGVSLPFRVIPVINEMPHNNRVEGQISVKSLFTAKTWATSVVIKVPLPPNTAKTNIRCSHGRAKYHPEHEAILWKLRRFPGRASCSLSFGAALIPTTSKSKKQWNRPPITMNFSVPLITASGLRVRYLRILENKGDKYECGRWVRYMTKAGSFQIRI